MKSTNNVWESIGSQTMAYKSLWIFVIHENINIFMISVYFEISSDNTSINISSATLVNGIDITYH